MNLTLQERGPRWLGLFAGHGPHGAGACRALFVEAEFRHLGQPRHLPSQQGKAEAAHPHACFSKGYSSTAPCTPLQHLWGSKTHTQACLHTRTRVHAHTRTHACARAHIQTQTRTHTYTCTRTNTCTRTHTYTCTRTNTDIHASTNTHAQTHRYTRTHAHTHIHTHACARTHLHAHMHMHAHVALVMGFANFSASLATPPHLSHASLQPFCGF